MSAARGSVKGAAGSPQEAAASGSQRAFNAALFGIGALSYSGLGVLSQASKEADLTYGYSVPSVLVVAEFAKLLLSFAGLSREEGGLLGALRALYRAGWRLWWPFAVPSVLYAVNNNLDMIINLYMDPASEQVLAQMKILTTGVFWWLVFRKPLGLRKWIALVLLTAGSCFAALPRKLEGTERTMWVTPFGVLLEVIYVSISASAGVYSEYVYKRAGLSQSMNLQNVPMYTFGMFVNAFMMWREGSAVLPPTVLVRGYNWVTWCMVANYACFGLLMAFIMKHLTNIHKLLIQSASMYTSTALTWALFGFRPTAPFCVGLAIVTAAFACYHWESLRQLLPVSEKRA